MRRAQSEKYSRNKRKGNDEYPSTDPFDRITCSLYLDADYEIIISTGDHEFQAPVVLKIRGDNGIVSIPLYKSKTSDKPFQAKSTNEFTCRTNDVGKIKRITLEHEGTDDKLLWHIKTVQIKKDNENYKYGSNEVNCLFFL